MLILTRKPGESLYIGDNIKITIVELKGHQIRVGIDAPPELRIYREEIYLQILEENKKAAEAPQGADVGLEHLTAAWSERRAKGPKAAGGEEGGEKGGSDSGDDEEKPKLVAKPALSGFFTSKSREGGPQVIIKKRRAKRDDD
ncbi:MAG: carbon storage regulator [Proteobacteria bacterium]|nr:MAG: carbon storage regulator [Pseudomonadota bacterium]